MRNLPVAPQEAMARAVSFFEDLQPAHLEAMDLLYAPGARFKDPFQEVVGVRAIQQVFEHMFENLIEPRFVVTNRVLDGSQCFLTWEFLFGFQRFRVRETQCIRGASHLVFDEHGRITLHRDYWDAAEELYEKLPGIGSLMRYLKKRART